MTVPTESAGLAGLLRELVAAAPIGLAVLDRNLRTVYANAHMAGLAGLAAEEAIGRRPAEIAPEAAARIEPRLRRVLATGLPIRDLEFEGRVPPVPDRLRSFSVSVLPLREHGSVVAIGLAAREISDRRRIERDRDEAHALLDALFEAAPVGVGFWDTDLRCRRVNGRLAEMLGIPADGHVGRTLPEILPAVDAGLLGRVVEEGAELVDIHVEGATPAHPAVRRHWSLSCFPVRGRDGEVLGAGCVIRETTEAVRRRALLEEELQEERRIASTLQRALLPRSLPPMEGVSMAARYQAAGARHQVGGDFYDVFETVDRRWVVAVGDVCGKGPEAAAVTALARYTLRAESRHTGRPARLLELLNAELLDQYAPGWSSGAPAPFATVALAALRRRPDGVEARLACAGHPPPIVVRRDGGGGVVDAGGSALGLSEAPRFAEVDVRLAAGDALVLYTDGVLDAHAPARQLSPEDLRAELEPGAGLGAEALAARVGDLVTAGPGEPRDDVALLVLCVDG